jgi:cell wall assembly regulator SMI1
MREIWDRIESWLTANAPKVLAELRPGADESVLTSVEQQLQVRFPESARESYLIHDGAQGEALLGYWQFLSLEQMLIAWKKLKNGYDKGYFAESGGPGCKDLAGVGFPIGPIQPHWWNPKWIPFAESEGHHFCFDLDPTKGGRASQVLMWDRSLDKRKLLAPSFEEWWREFADDLERGRRVQDRRGVLRKA